MKLFWKSTYTFICSWLMSSEFGILIILPRLNQAGQKKNRSSPKYYFCRSPGLCQAGHWSRSNWFPISGSTRDMPPDSDPSNLVHPALYKSDHWNTTTTSLEHNKSPGIICQGSPAVQARPMTPQNQNLLYILISRS